MRGISPSIRERNRKLKKTEWSSVEEKPSSRHNTLMKRPPTGVEGTNPGQTDRPQLTTETTMTDTPDRASHPQNLRLGVPLTTEVATPPQIDQGPPGPIHPHRHQRKLQKGSI